MDGPDEPHALEKRARNSPGVIQKNRDVGPVTVEQLKMSRQERLFATMRQAELHLSGGR